MVTSESDVCSPLQSIFCELCVKYLLGHSSDNHSASAGENLLEDTSGLCCRAISCYLDV